MVNYFVFFLGIPNTQFQRLLYAPATLGIEGCLVTKEKIKSQLTNGTENFKSKMQEFVAREDRSMIFTEDLKNMIHIAEDSKDVELIEKMIRRFTTQNQELRFGNYVFGPVVMRMLFQLKDQDTALYLFKDESFNGFFDQLMSYQILCDMLFESKRYQDVLDVYNIIKSRQVQGGRYPKHVIVIILAACYKMNTPEALQYTVELWKELQNAGHIPMRKASTFAAALALNQNSPHIALEIVSQVKQQKYVTVRNIKVLALADLNRHEDVLPILRSVLEVENPLDIKHTFSKDVIEKLEASFSKITNKDLQMDFQRILNFLKENKHISDNDSLDGLLCGEILTTAQGNPTFGSRDRNVVAANFRNRDDGKYRYKDYKGDRNDNYQRRNNRPGLRDLY